MPDSVITDLPNIEVHRYAPLGLAGMTEWANGRWVIVINGADHPTRQRFTLAHEFKHILDNPYISVLYPDAMGMPSKSRAEQICHYFAASLLMPRDWVREAWRKGPQDVAKLAARFKVSRGAMRIRLSQVGLVDAHRPEGP